MSELTWTRRVLYSLWSWRVCKYDLSLAVHCLMQVRGMAPLMEPQECTHQAGVKEAITKLGTNFLRHVNVIPLTYMTTLVRNRFPPGIVIACCAPAF